MENFTPVSATIGGLLIGLSGVLLLALLGRIAGVSGILGGLLGAARGDSGWRWAFVAGMVGGGALLRIVSPEVFGTQALEIPPLVILLGGLLVGFGTRLGSGCTSGHGVCGLSRLSSRSLAATATFMFTGMLTVFITRHVIGG